jgi:signal transduction histidine kinase
LVNVIRNALEAMTPQPGECAGLAAPVITLESETRTVVGSDGRSRAMAVLSVRDRGPGVSPRVMERMFNPFFTTRASGTGLGLAIVHRIVDAHGGRVSVRNHEEGGAVVELVLPPAPSPNAKEGPPGGGGREDA